MTADEKREQKGMLLLEYHEAQENLAPQLREKATRVCGGFSEMSSWLHWGSESSLEVRENHERRELMTAKIMNNSDTYRALTNFDEAIELMNEIAVAERKVRDLAQRKSALGLS